MQHAVDAVAHDQAILERLDVNVGRAHFQRVGDDQRDQADHGRFRREILELLDVGVEADVVALLDVAEDLVQRRLARAVESLQRGIDLRRNRDERSDLAPRHHLECVHGVAIGGIGHRQRELAFAFGEWQCAGFTQEARRYALLEYR